MDEEQMQMEVDWCVARLEEKLAGMDPYSRPAREVAKVHRILTSSKAPVVKKRQAMRNMFGDYRAKMKATEKETLKALKKSKLVAVKEPPSDSKFLRLSTSAQLAQKTAINVVTSASEDFNQLSVSEESQSESKAKDISVDNAAASDNSEMKDTTDNIGNVAGSSKAKDIPDSTTSVSEQSAHVSSSETKFKFNFDGTECASDAVVATSARPAVRQNYYEFKPSNEKFCFNFSQDELI